MRALACSNVQSAMLDDLMSGSGQLEREIRTDSIRLDQAPCRHTDWMRFR